ncbi:hypothetical protein ATI61_119183 [Archangium gephyra]|uniref:Uncharacterized protein n=1 Tax=Archangium gephyra TaxID=48 RepID=A0AAC8TF15_9BACT|nr:hypothetical protein [Archangium gephyra]AKJ03567.1 Hypothetical protein AA314_05193 [Archangium gephyra]REG22651.1 hypothetical protein ATI61_119183 [Archangium gephyra]
MRNPVVTEPMLPSNPAAMKSDTRWAVVRRVLLAHGRATAWLQSRAARPQF